MRGTKRLLLTGVTTQTPLPDVDTRHGYTQIGVGKASMGITGLYCLIAVGPAGVCPHADATRVRERTAVEDRYPLVSRSLSLCRAYVSTVERGGDTYPLSRNARLSRGGEALPPMTQESSRPELTFVGGSTGVTTVDRRGDRRSGTRQICPTRMAKTCYMSKSDTDLRRVGRDTGANPLRS